jgi:hypothetical protein
MGTIDEMSDKLLLPGERVIWDGIPVRVVGIYPANVSTTFDNRLPNIEWSKLNKSIVLVFSNGYRALGNEVKPCEK